MAHSFGKQSRKHRGGWLQCIRRWWRLRRYVAHDERDHSRGLYEDVNLLERSDCEEDDYSAFMIDITAVDLVHTEETDRDEGRPETSQQSPLSARSVRLETPATKASTPHVVTPPNSPLVPMPKYLSSAGTAKQVKFARNRTLDSFQGSLESIDSLAESYWDPEDDSSHSTPVTTNLARTGEFFNEHIHFLRVQTQPRKVEIVWSTPPKEKKQKK